MYWHITLSLVCLLDMELFIWAIKQLLIILLKLRQSSNNSLTLLDPEDSFTIIMQTYNRTDILLKLLNHYQAVPHLQSIIIVWNNPSESPPRKLWDALGPHPVPIIFKEQSVNRMRNRLQPHPEIKTDGGCEILR
uniref:Glycosyl transferase 64 domain-containing protein n=1 Tax=Sinocyclocheilus grahami TaxID=75366 RepID=A0A672KRU2_SINGR